MFFLTFQTIHIHCPVEPLPSLEGKVSVLSIHDDKKFIISKMKDFGKDEIPFSQSHWDIGLFQNSNSDFCFFLLFVPLS